MSKVKIRDFPTGEITDNNDYFALATASGHTVKVPYSTLAAVILQSSLIQGNNITITDATEQDGLKRFRISADASTEWYYGSTQPVSVQSGDYWIDTTNGNNLAVYQYTNSQWISTGMYLKGTQGTDGITPHIDNTSKHWIIGEVDTGVMAEGQNGINGTNGTNGYSISATTTSITGGHRVTIHSTDPNVSDTYFDVMDGQGGGGGSTKTLLFDNSYSSTKPTNIEFDSPPLGVYDEFEIEYIRFPVLNKEEEAISTQIIRVNLNSIQQLIHTYVDTYEYYVAGIPLYGKGNEYEFYCFDEYGYSLGNLSQYSTGTDTATLVINKIWGIK